MQWLLKNLCFPRCPNAPKNNKATTLPEHITISLPTKALNPIKKHLPNSHLTSNAITNTTTFIPSAMEKQMRAILASQHTHHTNIFLASVWLQHVFNFEPIKDIRPNKTFNFRGSFCLSNIIGQMKSLRNVKTNQVKK